MSKNAPSYEALSGNAQNEKTSLLEKIAYWFRDFLENAE